MSSDKCVESVSSHLIEIIGEKDAVKPWKNLEIEQQKEIEKGIASSNPPNWVVYPHTQEQLAKVMAEAYHQDWRVLVCGSGSKISWGDFS